MSLTPNRHDSNHTNKKTKQAKNYDDDGDNDDDYDDDNNDNNNHYIIGNIVKDQHNKDNHNKVNHNKTKTIPKKRNLGKYFLFGSVWCPYPQTLGVSVVSRLRDSYMEMYYPATFISVV